MSSEQGPKYQLFTNEDSNDQEQSISNNNTANSNSNSTTTNFSTNLNSSSTRTRTATTAGRSQSAITRQRETAIVVSITENRRREIGIAWIDLKSPHLYLAQYVDSFSYIHTLTRLSILDPIEIIIPNTAQDSELALLIGTKLNDSTLSTIQRKYFSESKGTMYLKNLVLSEQQSTIELESSKFLCLASCSALIKYVEFIQNMSFANHSIKMTFESGERSMLIDCETIKNLEIIQGLRSSSIKGSLFDVVNFTKTTVGRRLLKATLVQPLADLETIHGRHEVIEKLLSNEQATLKISELLASFPDLDSIIFQSNLVQISKRQTTASSQAVIRSVLYLKHTLQQLPLLGQALSECAESSPILNAMSKSLSNNGLDEIRKSIDQVLNEDSSLGGSVFSAGPNAAVKSAYNVRMQQCFAVKTGINGLLDVARKTYSEVVEDIHALIKDYRSTYGINSLKVQFTTKRGHYLLMNEEKLAQIPEIFIQVNRQARGRLTCTTDTLLKLNQRFEDSLTEVLLCTNRVVEELLHSIRQHMGSIYKLSDCIALLDLLCSFATYAMKTPYSVKPEFSTEKDTPLLIKQGKHPLTEKLCLDSFIPNDTFASPQQSRFQIITGANMSGKSTYIRQIASLVILAHCGCWVPANYFMCPLIDRLFTRIGTSDQVEGNLSSFTKEMVEMNYILQNVTDRSLVIVDELGRGTSNQDGVALCWAICEHLISKSNAFVFFVTHFLQLLELESLYGQVKNFRMAVTSSDENDDIQFLYQVTEGAITQHSYGLQMAEKAGLNSELMKLARDLKQDFSEKMSEKQKRLESQDQFVYTQTCISLVERLRSLKNSTMNENDLCKLLENIQEEYKLIFDRHKNLKEKEMEIEMSNQTTTTTSTTTTTATNANDTMILEIE